MVLKLVSKTQNSLALINDKLCRGSCKVIASPPFSPDIGLAALTNAS